jgi:hypothetical protein
MPSNAHYHVPVTVISKSSAIASEGLAIAWRIVRAAGKRLAERKKSAGLAKDVGGCPLCLRKAVSYKRTTWRTSPVLKAL